MTLEIAALAVPLRPDDQGAIRVGQTRVTLDTVICEFNQGAAPEQIVLDFPSLDLAEVYAVCAYYLHHRDEIDQYLARRQVEADKLRVEIEKRFPPEGIRERLLARRKANDAAAGG